MGLRKDWPATPVLLPPHPAPHTRTCPRKSSWGLLNEPQEKGYRLSVGGLCLQEEGEGLGGAGRGPEGNGMGLPGQKVAEESSQVAKSPVTPGLGVSVELFPSGLSFPICEMGALFLWRDRRLGKHLRVWPASGPAGLSPASTATPKIDPRVRSFNNTESDVVCSVERSGSVVHLLCGTSTQHFCAVSHLQEKGL